MIGFIWDKKTGILCPSFVSNHMITGRQKAVGYMIWKLLAAMRFCEPITVYV